MVTRICLGARRPPQGAAATSPTPPKGRNVYDFVTLLLFERLGTLVAVWAGVQFVLVAVWSWRRTPRSARVLWMGLVVLPLMISISLFVVTRRERIVHTCRTLAVFVERADLGAIERSLSDDFEAHGLDRDAFVQRLETTLKRYDVEEATLRGVRVTFQTPIDAVVELHATCRVRSADLPYERFVSDWRLRFGYAGSRWNLRNVERLPTAGSHLIRLRDLLP